MRIAVYFSAVTAIIAGGITWTVWLWLPGKATRTSQSPEIEKAAGSCARTEVQARAAMMKTYVLREDIYKV